MKISKISNYGQFWNPYIINETSGVGQAPLKAYESKYAYNYANNRLYAANSIDLNRFYTSINGLYDQDRITTNVDDNTWLNRAEFISTFKNDKRVFFIFNEETSNLNEENGNTRQSFKSSHIAQICQNDRGAPLNSLRNIWTTYLKSKLSCTHNTATNSPFSHESLSPTFKKSSIFYFDEISRKKK
ncbi:Semaphorin [Brachionus plicatilis]|uniref:Semaphorin n=1 Tax=Brachionus plicatilis TaxID=10195 RepID=A0A3M7SZ72_BRAPC|nr:Semaphorin [Brachionus plicatilis]